jgi:hypothetical protein
LQLAANQSRSYFGAALAAKQVNDSDKAKTYLANSLTFAVLAQLRCVAPTFLEHGRLGN